MSATINSLLSFGSHSQKQVNFKMYINQLSTVLLFSLVLVSLLGHYKRLHQTLIRNINGRLL